MTSRFELHIRGIASDLNSQFERIRRTHSDSSAKGQRNEEIIASFLDEHVPHWFIAKRVQILDSHDTLSDEVDVCVCNTDQPFRAEVSAPLIAEGVDFVVQVKAHLTSDEIDRAIMNCRSVKALEKAFAQGDETIAPVGVTPERLGKIPYVVFAFQSQLSPDTIHIRLEQGSAETDLIAQVDALFVLDRGLTFINFRDGSGNVWQNADKPIQGWLRAHSGELTLLELLRFANTQVPRIRRLVAPLSHYMPMSPGYRMVGRT